VGGAGLGTTGVALDVVPGTAPLPHLSAQSFVLADLSSGDVIAARNPHGQLRPASTLKVLTALTVMPDLDPASTYTAVFDDANVEGSKVGIVPGATYTVHNLFEGLFLLSGNDAANALANAAGGVPATVAAMNAKAHELGAMDTKVVNPSGLDADGQVTSAYDLALFARAAMDRDDFRAYVGTVKSQFPGKMPKPGKHRKTFEIYTQNKLVLNYKGAIGVKTGWTTKARGTFVGAATRGDRTLVATVMHTGPRAWAEAAALLDWGFAHVDAATAVGTLDQPREESGLASGSLSQRAVTVGARTAAAVTNSAELPWYAWVLAGLLAVVGSLRARVLLRRRLR
jgi:D-alanyl-D-alanine carboxypeptidase (penicillin-binding protein 5/6)